MPRDIKRLRHIVFLEQLQQAKDILLAGLHAARNVADAVFTAIGSDPAGHAVDIDAVAELDFLVRRSIKGTRKQLSNIGRCPADV